MNYHLIGQRIRRLRKLRNLSQEQLAEKVSISTTHMSHIETGSTKLSLPVLVDLAAALNVTTNEILSGIHEENLSSSAGEIIDILDSCNSVQTQIIMEVVKSTKQALDRYGH